MLVCPAAHPLCAVPWCSWCCCATSCGLCKDLLCHAASSPHHHAFESITTWSFCGVLCSFLARRSLLCLLFVVVLPAAHGALLCCCTAQLFAFVVLAQALMCVLVRFASRALCLLARWRFCESQTVRSGSKGAVDGIGNPKGSALASVGPSLARKTVNALLPCSAAAACCPHTHTASQALPAFRVPVSPASRASSVAAA